MHVCNENRPTCSDRVQVSQGEKIATDIIPNQFLYIKLLKMEYVRMHRGIGEVLQRPC